MLAFLCERRGKVLSREQLLARVWGNRYEGGPRTVDIHVRRLRAKLGEALPLETLRGSGYKLRVPDARRLPKKNDRRLDGLSRWRRPRGVRARPPRSSARRACVLVGDEAHAPRRGARASASPQKRLVLFDGRAASARSGRDRRRPPGPALAARDRKPGKPSNARGRGAARLRRRRLSPREGDAGARS